MSKTWGSKPLGMFRGADQTENFRSLATIFPCRVVRRARRRHRYRRGDTLPLPESFVHEGVQCSTAELLGGTETAGLLVWHAGELVYERYFLGASRSTQWACFSITKSFVATLAGIAVAEGAIRSVDDPVTDYVPQLAATAYDGVSIRHLLQMSSGARWDESYGDASSDVRASGRAFAQGGSRTDVALSLARELDPGTYHRYSSIDTHVLGMVVRRATKTPLSHYLHDKLWSRIGAESDAFWIVEGDGCEWTAAGLNATLRDIAKLGILYVQNGRWEEAELVPESWIRAAVTADAPHLRPGQRESSASPYGYGYQWWLPDATGPYCAMGVYNQFVYVDPSLELVIAKISANRSYGSTDQPESFREPEHFALFRAIGRRLA